ncbi:MAG: M35 family metallopeptidase [Bacteroidetes bacterium]|nr:M35 family metallopeptidase [Bacteroidota bacterium]
MTSVTTSITILSSTAEMLLIRFSITNHSDTAVMVLKRNTPLEGLRSDCLKVEVDGMSVPYDGYLVKRALPKPTEYILLNIDETLSHEVDISNAYDVSKPGTYSIQFDDRQLVIIPERDEAEPELFGITTVQTEIVADNQQAAVIRTVTEAGKQTIGQQLRMEQEDMMAELAELPAGILREAKIVGGTDAQKKVIGKAHKNCYKYLKRAVSKFRKDNRYKKWFGVYTEERAGHAASVLGKMRERMERTEFSYHINGSDCADSDYAYTTIGGRVIWLCTEFWNAPHTGLSSQAGTLVHEHSHASGGTDDYDYSLESCIRLAKTKPQKAIKNADNYEFYSESHFAG